MGRKRGRGEEKKGEKKKNFRKGKERWGEIWVLVVGYTCVLFVFQLFFMKLKGNCVDWRGCWCVFRSVFVFLCFFCFSLLFSYYSIGWGVVGVVGGLQRGFTSCSVDVDQCGVCVQRCALLCGPHKHQHLAMCMERSS